MNVEDPRVPQSIAENWPVIWPLLGGLGGAIVSLGLPWNEELPPRRKLFTVASGAIIAVFLGPIFVRWALGPGAHGDSEIVGAIYCIVGLAGTSITARFVRRLQKMIDTVPLPLGGNKEAED